MQGKNHNKTHTKLRLQRAHKRRVFGIVQLLKPRSQLLYERIAYAREPAFVQRLVPAVAPCFRYADDVGHAGQQRQAKRALDVDDALDVFVERDGRRRSEGRAFGCRRHTQNGAKMNN